MSESCASDQDPEMAAIKAIDAFLTPLDLQARRRLLGWADDKYVAAEERRIQEEAEAEAEAWRIHAEIEARAADEALFATAQS